MAKGVKKPAAKVLAAKSKQQPKKTNPFEIKKSKTKFETIGRRLKGTSKNVIKAREDAVTRRKKTLLVEYKQLRKANSFVDRRFGEHDDMLTEDDKAFAKLQSQRMKASKSRLGGGKKVKFALGGDEEAGDDGIGLTHMGKSLSEFENLNEAPELDDVDEDILKDYNFGGGDNDLTKGPDGKPKTRKEIMEEIIAKSKAFKAAKQKQKEDDLAAMEKLDEEYRELLSTQALAAFVKPKGYNRENKLKPTEKVDVDYDVATRELLFDPKGRAADRTLTAEEAAETTRQKLETLERERLKRMRRDVQNEEGGPGGQDDLGQHGGYAARRAKIMAKAAGGSDSDEEGEGEEEDEDEEGEEDEDEEGGDDDLTELIKRRMTRAAGDHPLQSAFREKAAELASKFGLGKIKNPAMSGSDDEDGEDDEGEDDEGEEEGDEGEEEDDDGEGEEAAAKQGAGSASGDEDDDEDDPYEQELKALLQERTEPTELPSTSQPAAGDRQQGRRDATAAQAQPTGPQDIAYTLPVPQSYEKFAEMVAGRPPSELIAVVMRIRGFNANALASDNKRKLQVLYGILVQHFASLSGQVPVPVAHLDALVPLLLTMTAEVPFYAATVARTRLSRIHDRLSAALAGVALPSLKPQGKVSAAAQQQPESPWPGSRALLQLKLYTTLFPASDKRHPVLTPASLLVGRALSQCVATDVGEVVRGLVLAGLGLHLAGPAKRHFPEVSTFLSDLLMSFCSVSAARDAKAKVAGSSTADAADEARWHVAPALMAPTASGKALSKIMPDQVELLQSISLPAGPGKQAPTSDSFKLGLLRVALHGVARSAELAVEHQDSCAEATASLRHALAALGTLQLPTELEQLRFSTLAQLVSMAATALATRRPLVRASMGRSTTSAVKEYNPRFEEGFTKGRDYDPDRERAEQRKLKKEFAKERRGAMRELRKDAVFMANERDRERAQVDAERMDSQRKFYTELQVQAADLNSGGQRGINGHLKKKRKK